MTITTRTDTTDRAPHTTAPHRLFADTTPADYDPDVAYYTDPDAAEWVIDAAATTHDLLGELADDLDGLKLSDPAHRDTLREHFRDILAGLDRMEEYDNETIRLSIAHQD